MAGTQAGDNLFDLQITKSSKQAMHQAASSIRQEMRSCVTNRFHRLDETVVRARSAQIPGCEV